MEDKKVSKLDLVVPSSPDTAACSLTVYHLAHLADLAQQNGTEDPYRDVFAGQIEDTVELTDSDFARIRHENGLFQTIRKHTPAPIVTQSLDQFTKQSGEDE